MKLITYSHQGSTHPGVLTAGDTAVYPLPYPSMQALIEAPWEQVRAAARQVSGEPIPLEQVTLLAPIPSPRQDIICLGMNYLDHAAESARYDGDSFRKDSAIPVYFSKRVAEAVPPGGWIESHPGLVEQLDYEVELAVIIGKAARKVPAERVSEYIFGYTIVNDVSARRLQTTHKQWYFGKGLDGFTPMGPCITTADEVAFPPALAISAKVNGELRQSSNTRLLITSIADIIAELSSGITLLPGTIIATGTPAGVGMGFDPPRVLKSGDVIECAIENIGTLRNSVQ